MLEDQSQKWETVFDVLIAKDVLEVCNDDKYFIFYDLISQVAEVFIRDTYVHNNCSVKA